jgi:hypothetical protein
MAALHHFKRTGGQCAADRATDGDDRVGEVEERVDDAPAPFVLVG